MFCCSMPQMRYSAAADRGRPASMTELTSVDLVIHVAMAAATRILGHDRWWNMTNIWDLLGSNLPGVAGVDPIGASPLPR